MVGSVLSLLVAVTFFTLSVWVCGDAVVSAVGLFAPGLANDATAAVAYGLAALATFSICIVGYRWLLAANKFLAPAMLILMALGFVALGGQIDLGYPGTGEYAVGGFWTTWFAALLIVMANPISYSPFLGDWSRYVPQRFPHAAFVWRSSSPKYRLSCRSCSVPPQHLWFRMQVRTSQGW